MRVSLLGPLEARDDAGRPVEIGGARLRALLARLALDAGSVVGTGVLLDALWDTERTTASQNALQAQVSRLRRALGNGAIESRPSGYRLDIPPEAVDALEFERLVSGAALSAEIGSAGTRPTEIGRERVEVLRTAEALWRGPALVDVGDAPFAPLVAARLEGMRLSAAEERCAAEIDADRATAVLAELEALTSANPLRERLHLLLIRAMYQVGRHAEALAAFERIRTTLATELGADPTPELAELHLAVLRRAPDPFTSAATSTPPETVSVDWQPPTDGWPDRRSLSGRPRGVPTRLTSFIGRDAELAEVRRLMHDHRLVTIVGAGGAGKTRLAVESVDDASPVDNGRSPEPADRWLIELASVTDPGGLPTAMLAAVGGRERTWFDRPIAGDPIGRTDGEDSRKMVTARLAAVLGERPALLVLDNCEHLVHAVAGLVGRLLGDCPELRILATSREPLGIGGEVLYPIPPLASPGADEYPDPAPELDPLNGSPPAASTDPLDYPAVRLFVDRARAVDPGFAPHGDELRAVVEICRRLDGMPLAIELAAARVRALSPRQIADRLDDRFRLLTGGSRNARPAHQTLRAVVDWSWDLLGPAERTLAGRLSVFSGGMTLEAVEAVGGGGSVRAEEVLDLLAGLVDKSLVERRDDGPDVRYRMLETVRLYAAERLDESGETAALRAAHADYVVHLVRTAEPMLRSADQLPFLARLNAEHDNVLAALHWAVETSNAAVGTAVVASMWFDWLLLGTKTEQVDMVEVVLGLDGPARPVDLAIAHAVLGIGRLHTADPAAGLRSLVRAVRYARRADPDEVPGLLKLLPAALRRWRGPLEPSTSSSGPAGEAVAGDEPDALESDRIRELRALLPKLRGWDYALGHLALSLLSRDEGRMREAAEWAELAVAEFETVGERWGYAMAAQAVAEHRARAGDIDAAMAFVGHAVDSIAELGAREELRVARAEAARMLARAGDLDRAEATLVASDPSDRLDTGAFTNTGEVFTRLAAAEIALRRGRRDSAVRALEDLYMAPGPGSELASQVGALRARIAVLDGDLALAGRLFAEAADHALASAELPALARVVRMAAALPVAEGDPERGARLVGLATALLGEEDHGGFDPVCSAAEARNQLGDPRYGEVYRRAAELSRARAFVEAQRELGVARSPDGQSGASAVCA